MRVTRIGDFGAWALDALLFLFRKRFVVLEQIGSAFSGVDPKKFVVTDMVLWRWHGLIEIARVGNRIGHCIVVRLVEQGWWAAESHREWTMGARVVVKRWERWIHARR